MMMITTTTAATDVTVVFELDFDPVVSVAVGDEVYVYSEHSAKPFMASNVPN